MNFDIILKICGLGVFIFTVEKAFSKAGKSNLAFLVDLAGFLIALSMVVKIIFDLFNSVGSQFPMSL